MFEKFEKLMIMRNLRLLYVSLVLVTLEVCHNVTLLSKSFSEFLFEL